MRWNSQNCISPKILISTKQHTFRAQTYPNPDIGDIYNICITFLHPLAKCVWSNELILANCVWSNEWILAKRMHVHHCFTDFKSVKAASEKTKSGTISSILGIFSMAMGLDLVFIQSCSEFTYYFIYLLLYYLIYFIAQVINMFTNQLEKLTIMKLWFSLFLTLHRHDF